ncbi:MAG: hypothetical protein ACXW4B_05585 [Micavibrio sp.]
MRTNSFNVTSANDSGSMGSSQISHNRLPRPTFYDEPSPFEVLKKVQAAKRLTLRKKMERLDHPWIQKLISRIDQLIRMLDEEQPEDKQVLPTSYQGLYNFLSHHDDLLYPSLTVSSSGNLRAQWTASKEQHLVLEFLSADLLKFVLFAPDPIRPYQTARISGTTSINGIFPAISAYGTNWVFECVATH